MRTAVCAVIIKNNAILLVKKKEKWILPGGKPEGRENNTQCLMRELSEELPCLALKGELKYIGYSTGITPNSGTQLRAKLYLTDSNDDIDVGAEISAAEWASDPEKYQLSDITKKIIKKLRKKGLLQKIPTK